jgi:hypothetical protein
MNPDAIATYTGISKRSVCWILAYFNQYDTIEEEKEPQKKGTHLRDVDLEVSNPIFSTTIRY